MTALPAAVARPAPNTPSPRTRTWTAVRTMLSITALTESATGVTVSPWAWRMAWNAAKMKVNVSSKERTRR